MFHYTLFIWYSLSSNIMSDLHVHISASSAPWTICLLYIECCTGGRPMAALHVNGSIVHTHYSQARGCTRSKYQFSRFECDPTMIWTHSTRFSGMYSIPLGHLASTINMLCQLQFHAPRCLSGIVHIKNIGMCSLQQIQDMMLSFPLLIKTVLNHNLPIIFLPFVKRQLVSLGWLMLKSAFRSWQICSWVRVQLDFFSFN